MAGGPDPDAGRCTEVAEAGASLRIGMYKENAPSMRAAELGELVREIFENAAEGPDPGANSSWRGSS